MQSKTLRRAFAVGAATAVAAGAVITASYANAAVAFPVNAKFDYQIGGAYRTDAKVVSRDVFEKPAGSSFDICYINGFQSQPGNVSTKGTTAWFARNAPQLLLRNPTPSVPTHQSDPWAKQYYVDPNWDDEVILDIANRANHGPLADIIDEQIKRCADTGGEGVEFDNLDTYTRAFANVEDRRAAARDPEFDGWGKPTLISESDALAFAAVLVQRTKARGLQAGQKNAVEIAAKGKAIGFEFAVTESCGEYNECGPVEKVYKGKWVDVEYSSSGFSNACRAVGSAISVVLRNYAVSPPGTSGYKYKEC